MKANEIWATFQSLSRSQGFYGRLMENIENSGRKDEILAELESQNFKDAVDLILYIEC